MKGVVDSRPVREVLADEEKPQRPANWVTLTDYICNRLGIDATTDRNPWWKERAALAGRIKKAAADKGYSVEDCARAVDYCAHYRLHVDKPFGVLSFVDTAQERMFPIAGRRSSTRPPKPPVPATPRQAKVEAAWIRAVEAESARLASGDPEASEWLARFERVAGHMREAVIAEWRTTRG